MPKEKINMNSINYMVNKNPDVKFASKNPDTGDVKITSEIYDKLNDEILENFIHQSSDKK
jgi:hypothetical protein